ncbi:MAG: helix-turn-helix domain-containing protein [bacterium]
MTKAELRKRRMAMGKNQQQLADLLGISVRAIHSFEQGWRKVPVHVERQILFLAMLARATNKPAAPCWTATRCPTDVRKKCPAWELKAGNFCWFINGTLCKGASRRTWKAKMEICRRCKVFLAAVGPAVAAT